MRGRALCVLLLGWAAATGAEEEPPEPEDLSQAPRVVVSRDGTDLMYGQEKIGELAEGTRAVLRQTRGTWSKVRVAFGEKSWVEGWVRQAFTVPDTLANVRVAVGPPRRLHVYEGHTLPGMQFLEVPVKFQATPDGPKRVYFRWEEAASADLYLAVGRDQRILPYGYWRRKPLSARRVFERVEKHHALQLSAETPTIEKYVFAIPVALRQADLVLKDKAEAIRAPY